GLYLAGAGTAVAASFVVSVIAVRPAGPVPSYPTVATNRALARVASVLLGVLGLAWWFGAILAGYLLDAVSPLPAILFWIGMWVGLPITAVLLGNPWPSLSPFRTVFGLLERGAGALGARRLDLGLPYPTVLGRWPAVVLLFVALWCELVLFNSDSPRLIANLLLGYTVLTMAGMLLFGRIAWLRNAELFEVLLGWFGRVGPLGRRAVDPEVCQGCLDRCDPDRCIDCPECSVAAEPRERRAELRPWFVGLTEVRAAGWSDAAFIVLALGGVTYDGFKETAFYGTVAQPAFELALDVLGPADAVLTVQTAGLLVVWLGFLAAFGIAGWVTRALHDPDPRPQPLATTAGAYAATLLPIAGGYLVAHYLTVVIQGVVWVPMLLTNPLNTVAPPLDWIPTGAIWYLSVGAIVLGHIVAVVLAHRLALRDAPGRAVLAGLPLVLLMIGYTVLSLWIIAAPITVDPGTPAPAALRRP
ncbi:MAG TPA: hypothetical protein VHK28_10990, partial [Candidatus Limnocylindria bacterium]|nr:hypothetical protein [Candidatus Limnocylindria bacterium]